jgi:hypothetical protein
LDGFASADAGEKVKGQVVEEEEDGDVVDVREGVLNELFRYLDTDTTLYVSPIPFLPLKSPNSNPLPGT